MEPERLLECHYLPTCAYLAAILKSEAPNVWVEVKDFYLKGTFRNRANILSANGLLRLSIPVQHDNNTQKPLDSVRICYATHWPKQHWQAIKSAYNSSPFWIHYAEELEKLYLDNNEPLPERLVDWNLKVLLLLLKLLKINHQIQKTTEYQPSTQTAFQDFRPLLTHKNLLTQTAPTIVGGVDTPKLGVSTVYNQVFRHKFDFIPHLSVLDLLFCVGAKEARHYLMRL